MTTKPPSLSPVVRSVILETIEERLPRFRDPITGVIDDRALTVAVLAKVEESVDIAKMGKAEAWAVAVYELVRYYERTSKAHYAVHSQEARGVPRRAKASQRRIVTFRDASGAIVKKERDFLLVQEIPLVREQYARIRSGADDVVAWCDAVYEQARLLGLAGDTMVSAVLEIEEAA
ncbi:MAG: hypothetical protein KC442_03440 [Thermomicrobiales bacterium]|nr:hypothetical protein [Thermomicrobiales bacterium]